MTYVLLNLVFFLVVAVVLVVTVVVLRRRASLASPASAYAAASDARGRWVPAVLISLAVLLVLTAVFDTVIIAVGLVDYDTSHLLGLWMLGAPIEDFAYPIAGVVLLPCLWLLLERKESR